MKQSGHVLYFDHHATTPLDPEVLDVMMPWLTGLSGNASSIHEAGRAARQAVERARTEVAAAIGASPPEIVFTSGGTEADNLAVRGGALAAREGDARRRRVLFTGAEHAAVREAARGLTADGFEAVELPVDRNGLPAEVDAAFLDETTALVSAIYASNETGAIFDGLPDLAAKARGRGAFLHTDAVQAVGKIPMDVRALGVDLLSLTAHKFGGPQGAGALFIRSGIRVLPQINGGGQEKGRRAGTENVAAIAGLGAAARIAARRLAEERPRLAALRDRFESGLSDAIPGVRFNATVGTVRRLPTVSSVVVPGADGETLLVALDLEGIAASSGSACASGTSAPSRVLLACGLPVADVRSTLRFSFGRTTTSEDVSRLLELLPRLVGRVRSAGGLDLKTPAAL